MNGAINFETVSRNLKGARVRKGLTQQDVADHLGVSLTTVRNLENNPASINLKKMIQFAELYGCTASSFFAE